MEQEPCCAPRRSRREIERTTDAARRGPPGIDLDLDLDLVDIPGGVFIMGSNDEDRWPGDREGPARSVRVSDYRIGRYAVANQTFAAFVEATGYVTDAERFGRSFVFGGLLPDDFPATRAVASAPWWREVEGASWKQPFGPQSSIAGLADHPVVHTSQHDAENFCSWARVRLPTEFEWERAARGGLEQRRYVWGDVFAPDGQTMCNIFEGEFPAHNTMEDGYAGTAPVHAFPPNGFGLYNMAGNVWEWCRDLFVPTSGDIVIRGGSYLCHDSYCDRYRVSARSSSTADSSTGNIGFRVAADP